MMDREQLLSEIIDISSIVYRLNRMFSQGVDNTDEDKCPAMPKSQFFTLIVLHKEKVLTMSDLADSMLMPRQQMTKIVDALVEKGYVSRKNDPDNRRHVLIQLTDSGGRFVVDMLMCRGSILSHIRQSLSDEETMRMLDAIKTIKGILAAVPNRKDA